MLIIEDETFIAMDLERWSRASATACSASRAPTPRRSRSPARRRRASSSPTSSSPTAAPASTPSTSCCDFEVPVIFITAYPERFLTGERPEPAFLIAKPFQPAMVSAIASQALFFSRNARTAEEGAPRTRCAWHRVIRGAICDPANTLRAHALAPRQQPAAARRPQPRSRA